MLTMVQARKTQKRTGSVRIVGGSWRGRRLPVLDRLGLRPTGDRQRETLFNWLQGVLPGAVCLDLFAGTGVLGLEALSRGATYLQSVELDKAVAQQLQDNVRLLQADAKVVQGDWRRFLSADQQKYQLVFLDPPFKEQLLPVVLPLVDQVLATEAWVYVEDDAAHQPPEWPAHWKLKKEKISGGTAVRLFHIVSRDT